MNRISKIALLVFVVFWVLFISVDYWQKHPTYFFAFKQFQYWGLSIFLLLLGGGAGWAVLRFSKKGKAPWLNGLTVFLLFLLVSVSSVGFAYGQLDDAGSFSFPKAGRVIGFIASSALALYCLVVVSYASGKSITNALGLKLPPRDEVVIDIAMGLFSISMVLFLLGALSILHIWSILPVLVIPLIFGRKHAWDFLRRSLLKPIELTGISWIGLGSAYLFLVLMSINFTAVNVPMPAGFDALTLYANVPSLISQQHGLVEGYQPYNWSLLMSLGHIIFDSTAISLAISWLGGLLSLVALHALCRTWLKLDVNYTLLALLVFALTPAFTIQSTAELKIDLGLLFVYLSILLLFLTYTKRISKEKPGLSPRVPRDLLLMGLLTGFALGIKLTTVYFAFALITTIWFVHARVRGLVAAFLFALFLVFVAKLDDVGGLRAYHLGVENLQWAVLLASLLLMTGVFLENKKALLSSVRHSVIFGLFLVLPFLPWMTKNYVETKSTSVQTLINGKQVQPALGPMTEKPNDGN